MSGERGTNTTASSLFEGKQFWLSQNVPQRTRFKEIIQTHGGIIRLQEKDADIKLVDHTRKNLPPDTYSYRFVENSVRHGRLENLDLYRAGPSPSRPVGATNVPTRGHKIQYSLEDDQALWDWMQPYESMAKAPIRGNKIYEEFAAQNPRHTYQSYRDRYLKRLRGRPRPGGMPPPSQTPREKTERRPARTSVSEAKVQQPPNDPADRKRKQPADIDHHQSPGAEASTHKRRVIENTPKSTTPPQPRPSRSPARSSVASTTRDSTPRPPASTNANPKRTEHVEPAEEVISQKGDDAAVDSFLMELPFLPPSPEPETPETAGQDIDTWIDDLLETGRAPNLDTIVEALHCTSMDPQLAEKVLEHLSAGKGIPDDIPGIWTHEDDKCVEIGNARAVDKVLKKHGSENFDARWSFLNNAREQGLEERTGV